MFVALIAVLGLGKATAQIDQGLSDQELIDPWLRAKAVVLSLAPLLDTPAANDQRGRLDADLSKLADELSKLAGGAGKGRHSHRGRPGVRLRSEPHVVRAVAAGARHREELRRAVRRVEDPRTSRCPGHAKLHALSAADPQQTGSFERDVIRAIASGSKNEMQALAGQWWRVGESVEGVKLAVEGLRHDDSHVRGERMSCSMIRMGGGGWCCLCRSVRHMPMSWMSPISKRRLFYAVTTRWASSGWKRCDAASRRTMPPWVLSRHIRSQPGRSFPGALDNCVETDGR